MGSNAFERAVSKRGRQASVLCGLWRAHLASFIAWNVRERSDGLQVGWLAGRRATEPRAPVHATPGEPEPGMRTNEGEPGAGGEPVEPGGDSSPPCGHRGLGLGLGSGLGFGFGFGLGFGSASGLRLG